MKTFVVLIFAVVAAIINAIESIREQWRKLRKDYQRHKKYWTKEEAPHDNSE